MKLIHIGLGKTGTTTLQKFVFPKIASKIKDCEFNNRQVQRLLRKGHFYKLDENEREMLDAYFHNAKNVIISDEGLVNWNPHGWQRAADVNLELFGRDALILITVREDASYLNSIYVQCVQEGLVKPPEEFFLNADDYAAIAGHVGQQNVKYYDYSMHDIAALVALYRERFENVCLARLETLKELPFIDDISSLTEEDKKDIRNAAKVTPRANSSYSTLAMQITFARERLFSALGAQSRWSDNDAPLRRWRALKTEVTDRKLAKTIYFQNLSEQEKLRHLPRRVLGAIFSWRQVMQRIVTPLSPKRYRLPEGLIPASIIERNNAFIDREAL